MVIAIIAILAAMLLPALSRAKQQAQRTDCVNKLRQMGLALRMYVEDSAQKYPFYSQYVPPFYQKILWWHEALGPYYPVKWTNRTYHCPAYKIIVQSPYQGSYGYNACGTWLYGPQPHANLGLGSPYPNAFDWPAVIESIVKNPSETIAMADSRQYPPAPPLTVKDVAGIGWDWLYCGRHPFITRIEDSVPRRHGKVYNVSFCDGHVSGIDRLRLFNPTNSALMWNNDDQPHPETWP